LNVIVTVASEVVVFGATVTAYGDGGSTVNDTVEGSEHGTAAGVGQERISIVCVPTAHGPAGSGVA
jgi:hypothetical protein